VVADTEAIYADIQTQMKSTPYLLDCKRRLIMFFHFVRLTIKGGLYFFSCLSNGLDQWFLTGVGACHPGGVINFQGGANPYASWNMESLISKFTN